jgi:membrane-associated protease RseP (regulator of RpoE activity)
MKGIGLIVLGLVIGLIAATSFNWHPGSEEQLLAPVSGGSTEQLEALRAHIDQQLTAVDERLSELGSAVENLSEQLASVEVLPAEMPVAVSDQSNAQRRIRAMLSGFQQDERERILAQGFTQDRIDWLDRRVEELQMEARQAQTEAAVAGESIELDPFQAMISVVEPQSLLRPEIGDDEYERYLRAKGRPTTVEISRVLASSPAEQGGLSEGDEIVAYGGERVFSFLELNSLAAKRNSGESVLVEIRRDGQSMQLTLPGGDMGIDSNVIFTVEDIVN